MDIDFLGFGPRRETAASGGRGLAAGWPHRARRTAAGLAVLLVLSAGSSSMAQGRRVALVVVGNDAYQAQGVLRNAVNDARAVAAALGEAGLVVVTRVENAAPPAVALGRNTKLVLCVSLLGAESSRRRAVTVGRITGATVLTLFVLPSLYLWFEGGRKLSVRRRARR